MRVLLGRMMLTPADPDAAMRESRHEHLRRMTRRALGPLTAGHDETPRSAAPVVGGSVAVSGVVFSIVVRLELGRSA